MWTLLWVGLALASTQGGADGRPLSPAEAVRLALEAAPSLDAQEAQTRQARRDAEVAAVDFAPRLEGTASYTRLSEVDLPPLDFGGMEIDNPFVPVLDNYTAKGTVTWPVSDLFFSILPAYRAQLSAVRLQEAQEAVEEAKVARSALQAYYQLVKVREGVAVAGDGVAVLESHLEQLDALFSAGQVTRADTLSASAQLAEARAQQASLERSEAVAEAHLCSLLQVEAPVEVALPEVEPEEVLEQPTTAWVERALDHRPEVRVLNEVIETHRRAARAQRGAALPHLALVGNYTYANPNQRILPPTAEFYGTWDATVALTWSPHESLKQANGASQSRTEKIKAEADRESLERGLQVQVASALADRAAALRLTGVAQEQLLAAEAAFEAQSDLLAVGSSTATESLQAESAARRARYALNDARVGFLLAEIELQYAIGELLAASTETQP